VATNLNTGHSQRLAEAEPFAVMAPYRRAPVSKRLKKSGGKPAYPCFGEIITMNGISPCERHRQPSPVTTCLSPFLRLA